MKKYLSSDISCLVLSLYSLHVTSVSDVTSAHAPRQLASLIHQSEHSSTEVREKTLLRFSTPQYPSSALVVHSEIKYKPFQEKWCI